MRLQNRKLIVIQLTYDEHFIVQGYPLPQEICLSYILKLVSLF